MAYLINDDCILCSRCKRACASGAIFFDGDKYSIDTARCVQCGSCSDICNMAAVIDTDAPVKSSIPHSEPIKLACDLLVLGGGGAGLTAAIKAAELSGKKVIVLEKLKKAGGCAIYAMGLRLFSTRWEAAAGIPDQMDDYIRSAMNTTRWELNPQLVANGFRSIPGFFDWLCTWASPEEAFEIKGSPFDPNKKTVDTKDREKGAGDFIMNKLIKRCADMGVEILTEHSASEFIRDEKGQITGVIADDPGGKTVISCSACLIATGNLAGSPLLEKAVPEYAGAFKRRTPHRLPSSNGDGVIMAEKAGIPVDYDSICVAYLGPMSMPAEPQLMAQEHRGEALNVNLEGKRWCNETFRGEEATWALLRQPKCTYYSIMDSTILNQEPLPPARILKDPMGGRNVGAGVPDPNEKENTERTFGPFGGHFMPRIEPDTEELKRISELKGGHLAIADSLEELAEKLGIDKDEFTATIKRYNSLCAKGHDDDFFKPAKFLMPIEKAPFYAFNFHMATDGAFGGLAVDENMQILGAEGPVKGLYAAGDTTSGRFINQGGEKKQIVNDLAWAFASGYLAGENIGVAIR